MSLLDLNMAGIVVEDLNVEIGRRMYPFFPKELIPEEAKRMLRLEVVGDVIRLYFLGMLLWDSEIERNFENISVEKEVSLNTRGEFENFLRQAIMGEIKNLNKIQLL